MAVVTHDMVVAPGTSSAVSAGYEVHRLAVRSTTAAAVMLLAAAVMLLCGVVRVVTSRAVGSEYSTNTAIHVQCAEFTECQ